MTPRAIDGIDGLRALVGESLGFSDYVEITAARVRRFAEATGGFQSIHIDAEWAAAEPPFGGAVVHDYLTLALGGGLFQEVAQIDGFSMTVNYGTGTVRFPTPLQVGSLARLGVRLLSVDEIAGGVQTSMEFTLQAEHATEPSCVAEVIFRSYV